MRVAVLGGTGRTGRLVVDELLHRGHEVVALVRDPGSAHLPSAVRLVKGDALEPEAVARTLEGCQAVCSALGQRRGEPLVAAAVADVLIQAMRTRGIRRFVGISGAGVTVEGDHKSGRDQLISALVRRLGGAMVHDKSNEHARWDGSGLEWTLVRPPRLIDGPALHAIEHAASTSPRRTVITRADLAVFIADCVDQRLYVEAAPLVAGGR